jgi:mono/diheme cytochrome c family protein
MLNERAVFAARYVKGPTRRRRIREGELSLSYGASRVRRFILLVFVTAMAVVTSFALRSIGAAQDQQPAAGIESISASTKTGAAIFASNCAVCHQPSGKGTDVFPALAGSKVVTAADPTAMITRIEHGKDMMPSWRGKLSNAEIAAVATYVRSSFGNAAGPVSESDVAAVK